MKNMTKQGKKMNWVEKLSANAKKIQEEEAKKQPRKWIFNKQRDTAMALDPYDDEVGLVLSMWSDEAILQVAPALVQEVAARSAKLTYSPFVAKARAA